MEWRSPLLTSILEMWNLSSAAWLRDVALQSLVVTCIIAESNLFGFLALVFEHGGGVQFQVCARLSKC